MASAIDAGPSQPAAGETLGESEPRSTPKPKSNNTRAPRTTPTTLPHSDKINTTVPLTPIPTTTTIIITTKRASKGRGRALSLWQWHQRLGYLNYADVKQLASYHSQIKLSNSKENFYELYTLSKQHAMPNHDP